MWQVFEHSRLDKQLSRLPREILKRYEKWKDVVTISGPPGLRLIRGFHDEALRGPLQAFRSSRLNLQYRVIYQVIAERSEIRVIRVSPHDYRGE
jgi:mRNA-degrading endonuclease RelE of RelBE toxin-antitoxin system